MNVFEKKISATLIAYAAGDAFGAFYEFSDIVSEVPDILMAKPDWPFGATSDDTSLTLITFIALKEIDPTLAASSFIKLLGLNREKLRGLGPTTRAALGMTVKDRELDSVGLTNGAMMRTALLGLIFNDPKQRFNWVNALAASTHRSYAVEAAVLLANHFAESDLSFDPTWRPSKHGVSNDAQESFNAVGYVTQKANSPLSAMQLACTLGGDTDTVAALSAAYLTSSAERYEDLFSISWLEQVDWDGLPEFPKALQSAFQRMGAQ